MQDTYLGAVLCYKLVRDAWKFKIKYVMSTGNFLKVKYAVPLWKTYKRHACPYDSYLCDWPVFLGPFKNRLRRPFSRDIIMSGL